MAKKKQEDQDEEQQPEQRPAASMMTVFRASRAVHLGGREDGLPNGLTPGQTIHMSRSNAPTLRRMTEAGHGEPVRVTVDQAAYALPCEQGDHEFKPTPRALADARFADGWNNHEMLHKASMYCMTRPLSDLGSEPNWPEFVKSQHITEIDKPRFAAFQRSAIDLAWLLEYPDHAAERRVQKAKAVLEAELAAQAQLTIAPKALNPSQARVALENAPEEGKPTAEDDLTEADRLEWRINARRRLESMARDVDKADDANQSRGLRAICDSARQAFEAEDHDVYNARVAEFHEAIRPKPDKRGDGWASAYPISA